MKFLAPPFFLPALLILFCCVISCRNDKIPEGVVARVNGENITLHDIRAAMDIKMGATGQPFPGTIEEARKNYIDALNALIAGALIRQDLAKKKLTIGERAYQLAQEEVKDDYGQEDFPKALEEAFIREEDFEKLLRDFVNMEVFQTSVLYPSINITAEEIRRYYEERKDAFDRPEIYNLCYVAAPARDEIIEWCEKAERGIIEEGDFAQCMKLPIENAPALKQTKLQSLKLNSCAQPEQNEDVWQTVYILDKAPARRLGVTESFPIIERILLNEKKSEAFNQWLENKIKTSRIEVIPTFNESLEKIVEEMDKEVE
ncbi:MAG: peptidylprolyl isomerase [Desulfovibrio sp.]|nr:peptidylprolyl isomerase [Desulfovibrio sp.]